jgi:alpha-tubulin suppressor-like RCC1 family protein
VRGISVLTLFVLVGCGARTPLREVDENGLPVATQNQAAIVSLSVGEAHGCVVRGNGEAWCWGNNSHGQIGDNTFERRPIPVKVLDLAYGVEIAAGRLHTCARIDDGSLRCWGHRALGQLGDGISLLTTSVFTVPSPAPVANVSGARAIAAGDSFTCAITHSGTLCFGSNDFGELGDGRIERSSSASNVIGLSDPTAMSLGAAHGCARNADKTVRCWGSNEAGQLNGSPADRCGSMFCSRKAIDTFDFGQVEQVALAGNRTCVRRDGGVLCVGALNTGVSFGPTAVPNLDDAVEIALGRSHGCARRADGTVWCWGEADRGQLGSVVNTPCPNGESLCSLTPVQVRGLPRAKRIALGGESSCALLEDDSVRCWGRNDKGQLGDGTTLDRTAPVRVAL